MQSLIEWLNNYKIFFGCSDKLLVRWLFAATSVRQLLGGGRLSLYWLRAVPLQTQPCAAAAAAAGAVRATALLPGSRPLRPAAQPQPAAALTLES